MNEMICDYKPDYEIIGGVKVMSPAPSLNHGSIIMRLSRIFVNYIIANDLQAAVFGDNTDVYFSDEYHFKPDLNVVCNAEIVKNRKTILGAPDLIVEVLSTSTMKNDISIKKDVYEKYGVKEYWIVNPWAQSVEVYHLIDGKFKLDEVYHAKPNDDNMDYETKSNIKVSIFKDLIVDIKSIFKWWFDE